ALPPLLGAISRWRRQWADAACSVASVSPASNSAIAAMSGRSLKVLDCVDQWSLEGGTRATAGVHRGDGRNGLQLCESGAGTTERSFAGHKTHCHFLSLRAP